MRRPAVFVLSACIAHIVSQSLNLLVKSSSEQLVLRHDSAVDGGIGALCWGFQEKTEGLGQSHQGTHEVPCDFSVDRTRVHSVSGHPKYCWPKRTVEAVNSHIEFWLTKQQLNHSQFIFIYPKKTQLRTSISLAC